MRDFISTKKYAKKELKSKRAHSPSAGYPPSTDETGRKGVKMTAYEIMTLNEESRDFYEEIWARRVLINNIMANFAKQGIEVTIEYQAPIYYISIKHGDKISFMFAFDPQGVSDMLYAISMYI